MIQSLIVGWIVLLVCAVVVGARMSILRWVSNHQKGDVVSLLLGFVAYIVDRLRRIAACKSWKFDLLGLLMSKMFAPSVAEVKVGHVVVVAIH